MNYKEINDYELLFLIKEQNEEANELLVKKYKNLINKHVEEFIHISKEYGLDENDLYQEGLIGLTSAMKTFDESKEASFFTYASVCIKTRMKTLLRASASKKNSMLNTSLSLDNINKTDENSFHEIITDDQSDLSEHLLKKEEQEDLLEKLNNKLTKFEREVLTLRMKDHTNIEIAQLLKKDRRSIENTMTRIRIKYKKYCK